MRGSAIHISSVLAPMNVTYVNLPTLDIGSNNLMFVKSQKASVQTKAEHHRIIMRMQIQVFTVS